jgi:hypothetical protein
MPEDVKQGQCCLCLDSEPKRVWTVQCTAIAGDVCDNHMELLVKQQNGKPTLFDGAK